MTYTDIIIQNVKFFNILKQIVVIGGEFLYNGFMNKKGWAQMKDFLIQLNSSQMVSREDLQSFIEDYFEAARPKEIDNFDFEEAFLFQNKSTGEIRTVFMVVDEFNKYIMLNQDFQIISSRFRTYNHYSIDKSLREILYKIKSPEERYVNGTESVVNCYFLNSLYDPSGFREPLIHFLAENSYGLIDLNGKHIIEPDYYTILPFSLKSEDFVPKISLLVCGKEHGNKYIDIYDINGNLIFSQIKDIRPKSETVNYKHGGIYYVAGNIPFEREVTQLEIIAENESGDNYSCIIPVKALYNEPSGEYPLHLHAIDDSCDWEIITSSVNLNRIKEAIMPMAKTIAEKQNQPLSRIIASIPIWKTLNITEKVLEGVGLTTPLASFTELDRSTQLMFRHHKLKTVKDLLETDLTDSFIILNREKVLKEAIVLKMRLIKTFEQQ